MKTRMLKIARSHYVRPDVPRSTQRHNIVSWARCIRYLGDNWKLANPIQLGRQP